MIRSLQKFLAGFAVLSVCAGAALVAGCGGGDDGGTNPPPPSCSLSAVTTGLDTSFLSGETVNIRWTGNGTPSTVVIELTKAGTVVGTIAASTANDGFHAWVANTGGQANGSDFGIRVTATGDAGCNAEKTGLTLLDVSGCAISGIVVPDTLQAGDVHSLTWTSASTSGTVDIELYKALPASLGDFVGVVATGVPDTGTYQWDVDSFHVGSLHYRLLISDPAVSGCEAMSDQFYMVDTDLCEIDVFGPLGAGAVHTAGTVMQITVDQTSTNGSGMVDLRLYSGAQFVPGGFIADNVPVLGGAFNWTVDDYDWTLTNTNYRIRAIDVSDPYCVGESETFSIVQP